MEGGNPGQGLEGERDDVRLLQSKRNMSGLCENGNMLVPKLQGSRFERTAIPEDTT
jgi:hypothetical protein